MMNANYGVREVATLRAPSVGEFHDEIKLVVLTQLVAMRLRRCRVVMQPDGDSIQGLHVVDSRTVSVSPREFSIRSRVLERFVRDFLRSG